ncbi:MAG: hypothetical protein WD270_05465 [Acetobacterales bacterium]
MPRTLAELRRRIEAIERAGTVGTASSAEDRLKLGLPALDGALVGGLPLGRLHDIHSGGDTDAAAAGFLTMLLARLVRQTGRPVLWCQPRRCVAPLYGPGLALFGLDPAQLILARPGGDAEGFWAVEEGLRCGRLAAVVGEPKGGVQPLVARRLQLAAREGGVTALLLLSPRAAPAAPPATARRVTAAQADGPALPFADAFSSRFARPCWQVELIRARGGRPGSWLVEWNHETGDLALATDLPDRPAETQRRTG